MVETRDGPGARRARRRVGLLALAFSAALLTLLADGQPTRAAGLSWPTSLRAVNVVGTASGASETTTDAEACWSASSCVAVGYDQDSAGKTVPIVVRITDGLPGIPVQTGLPSTGLSGSSASGHLYDVSCQPSGMCVAVGDYSGPQFTRGLMVPIDSGVAGTPEAVNPPGGSPSGYLDSVSCPGSGACVASGVSKSSRPELPMEVSISSGVIGPVNLITLPTSAQFDDANEGASVSCWTARACVVVGQYQDTDENDDEFVADVTDGLPGAAVENVSLPSDAYPDDGDGEQAGWLAAVSCSSSGACLAVGQYTDAHGGTEALLVPITDGQPAALTRPLVLPTGAESESSGQRSASLKAVSCPTAGGACVAVGAYGVGAGTDSNVPLVTELSATGAATAYVPSLPAGAVSEHTGSQYTGLYSVGCPEAGSCVATGLYDTTAGATPELEVTVTGGRVQAGQEAPLPARLIEPDPWEVACGTSGSCSVVASFGQNGHFGSYVQSLQTPLAVSTPSLRAGAVGSAYGQTLTASGAWDTYSWSLSSGSLPPGLGLNAKTGVISGVPTSGGTYPFTVKATGTGDPVQTATRSLSIFLPGGAVKRRLIGPTLRLSGNRLRATGNAVSVLIRCSGAACSGRLRLVYPHRVKRRFHKRKLVRTVVGSARYALAAGTAKRIKLRLNAGGRHLLLRLRRHRLSVLLKATVAGGRRRSWRVTVALGGRE